MRWNIKEGLTRWHAWFAWHPVKIDQRYVWLERVFRKGVKGPYGWDYEYRLRS